MPGGAEIEDAVAAGVQTRDERRSGNRGPRRMAVVSRLTSRFGRESQWRSTKPESKNPRRIADLAPGGSDWDSLRLASIVRLVRKSSSSRFFRQGRTCDFNPCPVIFPSRKQLRKVKGGFDPVRRKTLICL